MMEIGGRQVYLLRLLGILIVVASLILAISSTSELFMRAKQVKSAMGNSKLALSYFGVQPSDLTAEMAIGYFLEPIGWLVIWLSVMVIGTMVYKSSGVFIPVKEEIKEG